MFVRSQDKEYCICVRSQHEGALCSLDHKIKSTVYVLDHNMKGALCSLDHKMKSTVYVLDHNMKVLYVR